MLIGVLTVDQLRTPHRGITASCAMAVLVSLVGKSAWLIQVTFLLVL
jgi:hypothetical protein